MERWVGLGLLVHDLHVIAQHLMASQRIGQGRRQAVRC
jgi:hypothetical protein